MRALLLALALCVAIPAAAGARPLEPDRSFGTNGIFRMERWKGAISVLPLADGGTMHATYGATYGSRMMRLSASGKLRARHALQPPGEAREMLADGSGFLVFGHTRQPFGAPPKTDVWRVNANGRTLAHHDFELPAGMNFASGFVHRATGFAALGHLPRPYPESNQRAVLALTAAGTVDRAWGEGGVRPLAKQEGYAEIALASTAGGSLVVASGEQCRGKGRRAIVRVQRFGPAGEPGDDRRLVIGRPEDCGRFQASDVKVDRRGRTVVLGALRDDIVVLRLATDLSRDRSFGRAGAVTHRARRLYGSAFVHLGSRPGGGYAFGYTDDPLERPRATVVLVDARGRRVLSERLRVTRRRPTSRLDDLTVDTRGRLVASGALHDRNLEIREDYGQPHLAVWRVRTR